VAISPGDSENPATVRIDGSAFPVLGFAVEPDPKTGAPMLSLALAPDSLSIGEPPAPGASAAPGVPAVRHWGDGSQPDPRESIPGWTPDLGQQVAGHAEQRALKLTPEGTRMYRAPFLRLLQECVYVRLDGLLGGEGGSTAVTA
jgi:hypothetical protein